MRFALAACALALGTSLSAYAGELEGPPYIAIRSLESLQERITAGDSVAAAAHAKAIARTAVAFVKANPTVWSETRNARALALYLFSGGNAPAIAGAISRESIAKDQQTLFDGALAYGLGHDEEARDKLLPIDPRSMPSALGGHLALIQATLLASKDKAKAIELLDLARLLEPGTLVEEASLRKEMMLLGDDDATLAKFVLLARRYAGTFHQSLYADNFRQIIRTTAIETSGVDSLEAGAKLAKIVGSLDQVERRRLLLTTSRQALIAGRLRMAVYASEEAAHPPHKGDRDDARATLYFGAATIVGARYDQGLRALKSVAVADLSPGDQALRQSALAVADMIRDPAFALRPRQDETGAATLGAGARALAAADAALKRVVR